MQNKNSEIRFPDELLARALCAEQTLQKCGTDVLEAALLVREFCRMGRTKNIAELRKIFAAGIEALAASRKTLTLPEAFERYLAAKSHLRERTLRDYRGVFHTLISRFPKIAHAKMHIIPRIFDESVFAGIFRTPRQCRNAYSVLHAFFAWCIRRGWMHENPLETADLPRLREREITPLTLAEMHSIFRSAGKLGLGECVPAIALMLFAGIRPREIERLRWRDLDWEENVISIAPAHSKTGGCRHVSLPGILRETLRERGRASEQKICPPNWHRKWRRIRKSAGWIPINNPWQQDVLRHTFASYHLKFFRNLSQLQCEMGHASPGLLRTRYLSMNGITHESAARFWKGDWLAENSLFEKISDAGTNLPGTPQISDTETDAEKPKSACSPN